MCQEKLPDFVLPRTGSGTTYFIEKIIRRLERLGVVLINSGESIDIVKRQVIFTTNSWTIKSAVQTMLVKHPIKIELVEKNLKYPLIIKTLSGSYGSGVFMVDDKKQFRQLMKMRVN